MSSDFYENSFAPLQERLIVRIRIPIHFMDRISSLYLYLHPFFNTQTSAIGLPHGSQKHLQNFIVRNKSFDRSHSLDILNSEGHLYRE